MRPNWKIWTKSLQIWICLSVSLAYAGCATQNGSLPVSVDVDTFILNEPAPSNRIAPKVHPEPADPSASSEIAPTPSRLIGDPSSADEKSLRQAIETQQNHALDELETRLASYYQAHILETTELAETQRLSKDLDFQFERALDRIHMDFQAYAKERAEKIVRLSFLVGWPDPNPLSKLPAGHQKPYQVKQFEEAKQLRMDVKSIDGNFDLVARGYLDDVFNSQAISTSELRLKLARLKEDLAARAKKEASAQVPTSFKVLGLRLVDSQPVILPRIEGHSAWIPAERPIAPIRQVPSSTISNNLQARRQVVEHDLRIWLKLNRFELAKGGRNMTEDFRKWRESYRAGL
jgi:hypothetical protein